MSAGSPRFESATVTRLQRTRANLFVPLLVVLASVLSVATHARGHLLTNGIFSFAIVLSLVGVWLRGPPTAAVRAVHRGALAIDARGIAWNGATLATRDRIANGVLLPVTPNGPVVRVEVRGLLGALPIELGVRDADEGREVLRALGFDAAHVTASFRGRSRLAAHALPAGQMVMAAGVFAGLIGALGGNSMLAPVLIPLLLGTMIALLMAPSTVTVGTDGVLVGWLGTRRFVPYGRVARIEPTPTGVSLVCHDGAVIVLPVGPARAMPTRRREALHEQARAERDALVARIRDAMAADPDAAPALDRGALVRGERSVGEWLTQLRALAGRSEGGMRSAPVLREQLLACVNDAQAEPDARAGAAAALAASDDPAAREKLRVAARAVASPRLRVVFEAAADGDDSEALERALGRVDADARREG